MPDLVLLYREIYHLHTMKGHPYFVHLYDVFEDSQHIHLITELCTGGELYELALKTANDDTGHGLDESSLVIPLVRNILDAISYCHEVQHIVHRDLKASNFLFKSADDLTHVKIIDFGLSCYVPSKQQLDCYSHGLCVKEDCNSCDDKCTSCTKETHLSTDDEGGEKIALIRTTSSSLDEEECSYDNDSTTEKEQSCGVQPQQKWDEHEPSHQHANCDIMHYGLGVMTSRVGTPYYVAPEVLTQDEYTNKCDVWSIGVIAYLLCSGTLPILGKDERETVHLLMDPTVQVEFPKETWQDKPLAEEFCKSLLQKDPKLRPTARQAMSHEWIVQQCGVPPALPPPARIRDSLLHPGTHRISKDLFDDSLCEGSSTRTSSRNGILGLFRRSKTSIS